VKCMASRGYVQARRVEAAVVDPRTVLEMSLNDEPRPSTGMIPSQQLEEKRKAFVRPEFDITQKSCESIYLRNRR